MVSHYIIPHTLHDLQNINKLRKTKKKIKRKTKRYLKPVKEPNQAYSGQTENKFIRKYSFFQAKIHANSF